MHNLGERRAIVRIAEKSKNELDIARQVVEDVHKTLLAVSYCEVAFAGLDARICLSGDGSIPMRHVNGTYELDIYIINPCFARPSVR